MYNVASTISFPQFCVTKLRQSSRIVNFQMCSNQDKPEKRKEKNKT